jgi:hypothetical protein
MNYFDLVQYLSPVMEVIHIVDERMDDGDFTLSELVEVLELGNPKFKNVYSNKVYKVVNASILGIRRFVEESGMGDLKLYKDMNNVSIKRAHLNNEFDRFKNKYK